MKDERIDTLVFALATEVGKACSAGVALNEAVAALATVTAVVLVEQFGPDADTGQLADAMGVVLAASLERAATARKGG